MGKGKSGYGTGTQRAHHCPRGHTWKWACITKGHCKLCPKHDKVHRNEERCPGCVAIEDAELAEAEAAKAAEKIRLENIANQKKWDDGDAFFKPGKKDKV